MDFLLERTMFKATNTDGFWGLGTGDSEGGRRGGVSHAQWVSLSHTLALPHSLYLSPCVCLAPKGEDRRQSATTAHSSQTNEREKHHTKPDMALQQVGSILPSLSPPLSLTHLETKNHNIHSGDGPPFGALFYLCLLMHYYL